MEGTAPTFRAWLEDALRESGLSKRGLARRIAEKHPDGPTESAIESARRTLRRVLAGELVPTQPTRDSIEEALGRKDAPRVDGEDGDEPMTREAVVASLREMRASARRIERFLFGRQVSA